MATFIHHKDLLIACPYDKNHKIALRNQIKHIIDCEKKIQSKFSVCIYNASHRMARNEFAEHIKSCPDGRHHIRDLYSSAPERVDAQCPPTTSSLPDGKCAPNSEVPTSEVTVPSREEESESEDEWANDNCPDYSIFGEFLSQSQTSASGEKPKQKLTKNQKKRNRRKAAKEVEVKSIWD